MPITYLEKIQSGEFNGEGYRIAPSAALESFIEGFYVFSSAAGSHTHLNFNDGFPALVFLPGRQDSVTVMREKGSFVLSAVWASAGAIKNVYVTFDKPAAEVFIVRFYPAAFNAAVGLDAQYFRAHPVTPFEHLAKQSHFNMDGFYQCRSIEEKICFFEKHIQQSFEAMDSPEILHQSLAYIHKVKGKSTVRKLSSDVGVSYKWLERSFSKNIGILPKEYLQLQRFIHAYRDLVRSKEVDLMRIAVSNGYYDSNHFLKDFKTYTGKTPLEYRKFHCNLSQVP